MSENDEPWRNAIGELDEEVAGVQTMVKGCNVAIAALALALIDAGAVNASRLTDIIESLRVQLHADAVIENIGDVRDAELALEHLRGWLDARDWTEGQVVEDLHLLESVAFAALLLRSSRG